MSTGRVKEMATFLVEMGIQPDTYWSFTLHERNAIVEAYNTKVRRKR